MAPLIETGEVVEALEVYDGDVIEHPQTGEVMTIAAHMHMDPGPNYLVLMPGVVLFDVYNGINLDGPLSYEGPEHELVVTEGVRLLRLFQYAVPPGFRFK